MAKISYDIPVGVTRRGCLPRETRFGSEHPVFEDDSGIDPIPKREWKDLIEQSTSVESLNGAIHDQDGEGTCASNATCQGFETVLNMTYGKTKIQFSPISIYRWIARGPNTGSTIDGNLRQLRNTGVLPVDNSYNRKVLEAADLDPDHTLKHVGYYQKFPTGWKETAEYFQGVEAFEIGSMEGFAAAVFYDFPVVYGRDGHAICAVDLVYRNGDYYIKYANSWGKWGDKGYGYDKASYIARSVSSYGAWALRSIDVHDNILEAIRKLVTE